MTALQMADQTDPINPWIPKNPNEMVVIILLFNENLF